MSSLWNPVGTEEPSTYWRRRAVVIVGLLVVLWLAWMALHAVFGGDDPADGASPGPTASPAASTPAATTSPSPAGSASGSPKPTATTPEACSDKDISVTVTTSSPSTAVGSGMGLTLTIKNTGSAPCTRDIGAGANELVVTSGSVLVWSSDYCNPSTDADVQTLDPDKAWTSTVKWPGTVVSKKCPADAPVAVAGSYKAAGRNGDVDSKKVAFNVTK